MKEQTINLILGGDPAHGIPRELDITVSCESIGNVSLKFLTERIREIAVQQFPQGTVLHSRITNIVTTPQKEAEHGTKKE